MPLRVTMIFSVTTAPTDPTAAAPRTGAWSESFYFQAGGGISLVTLGFLLSRRANLLSKNASLVGIRQANYTISGNKIIPGGASASKVLYPGSNAYTTDVAQASLEIYGRASGFPNANRFRLGGLPDEVVLFGEYQPSPAYKAAVTTYLGALQAGGPPAAPVPPAGFIGRDLNQPSARVLAIAAGVVTVEGAIGGVVGTDYVRLRRVYDDTNTPVKGSFRMTNAIIVGPNTLYTLAGLSPTVTLTHASGTARIDKLVWMSYSSLNPGTCVVKKIGRPFIGYRGRASKKR